MNWFYAEGQQQKGPVTEADLENLVRSGTVRDETLVWREGMGDWQPYGQVKGSISALASAVAPGSAAPGIVCSQCGRAFAQDEVIRYGDVWVCATCKPAFVQRLKEGAMVPGALEYAGFWIRLGAKVLDGIILWVVNMAIGFVAGMAMGGLGTDPGEQVVFQLILTGLSVVLNLAYGVFFLGKFGATPGKMAAKLRVVTPDGAPISYGRAAGRCLAEILSGLICYIGYLIAAFDDEKRTLHDRLCNTRVIKAG